MKRYLLFFGLNYYPSGGFEDFVGDFDTIEDAKQAYENIFMSNYSEGVRSEEKYRKYQSSMTWAHIYDWQTKEIVWNA